MKKIVYISLMCSLLFALDGCNGQSSSPHRGSRWEATLSFADSLMRTRPDSALKLLYSLTPEGKPFPLGEGWGEAYYLLLLDAQNKCDTVFRSDTLQRALVSYYDRHGTPNERMRAYYLLGRACHDMGESPRALDCYQQAIDCADTTSTDCDYNLMLRIYSQKALLFHLQGLLEYEREALRLAEKYAWMAKDTLYAINSKEHQIGSYYLEGNFNRVIEICQAASKEYEKVGYKRNAAQALFSIIHIYIERGDFAKAKPLLERYERESGCISLNRQAIHGHELYYYEKGAYEKHVNHLDSAEYYFRKLLFDKNDYNLLQAGYKGLLSVYKQRNIGDSISKYAELYTAAADSSYIKKTSKDVSRVQSLYRYEKAKTDAQKYKNNLLRIYYIGISLLIIVLILSTWLYREYKMGKQKIRERLQQENLKYHQLLSEYQKINVTCSTLKTEKEELQKTCLCQKEELQAELTQYLGGDVDEQDWKDALNLSTIEVISRFHDYATKVKKPTKKEWRELYNMCEKLYPQFLFSINNFTRQNLTNNEKIVCILLKLQFVKSEISTLLDISSQSVTNYCTKINRKMFNVTGTKSIEYNIRHKKA